MSFEDHVTPLTLDDRELFLRYSAGATMLDDFFPWIMGSCAWSVFKGFKYHDGETLIVFSLKYGRFYRAFKAWGKDIPAKLFQWWECYGPRTGKHLTYWNIAPTQYEEMKTLFDERGYKLHLTPCAEVRFDIDGITDLQGKKWRKLRADVNAFNRKVGGATAERICEANLDEAYHVFKMWVVEARERKLLNPPTQRYRFVLNHCYEEPDSECFLYRLDGNPLGIHLNLKLSENCYTHAVGMFAARDVPNFAAWAQHDVFSRVEARGVTLIADGAAWEDFVDKKVKGRFDHTYKKKFNILPFETHYIIQVNPLTHVEEESPFFV